MGNYVGQDKNHLYLTRICNDIIDPSGNQYMSRVATHEAIFTSFEEARADLVDSMKRFDVDESDLFVGTVISEIRDFLIGEPMDEYDEVLKDHFPITMTINPDGSIIDFYSITGLWWKEKDMVEPNCKYDVGDIIDLYEGPKYVGTYVVFEKPVPFLESVKISETADYFGGYKLVGHNVFDDYTGEIDLDRIYDSDDIRLSKYFKIHEPVFNVLKMFAEYLDIVKDTGDYQFITNIDTIVKAYSTNELELNSILDDLQSHINGRR